MWPTDRSCHRSQPSSDPLRAGTEHSKRKRHLRRIRLSARSVRHCPGSEIESNWKSKRLSFPASLERLSSALGFVCPNSSGWHQRPRRRRLSARTQTSASAEHGQHFRSSRSVGNSCCGDFRRDSNCCRSTTADSQLWPLGSRRRSEDTNAPHVGSSRNGNRVPGSRSVPVGDGRQCSSEMVAAYR